MPTCSGWRTSSCASAQALARELGMPIGLYGDYAVGANPVGLGNLGAIAPAIAWAPKSARRRIRWR